MRNQTQTQSNEESKTDSTALRCDWMVEGTPLPFECSPSACLCLLLFFLSLSDEALTLGEQAKNQGLVEAFGTYVDITVSDVLKGKEKYGTALHTVKASDPVRVAMQAMNELQIGEKQRSRVEPRVASWTVCGRAKG